MLFRDELSAWAYPILKPGLGLDEFSQWISVPGDSGVGQATLPCFRASQLQKKPPQKIAEEWAQLLRKTPCPLVRRVDVANAYINFVFDGTYYSKAVLKSFRSDPEFGASWARKSYKGKRIVIDFSSPNMAKPIGIHHIRSTSIGHSLANHFEWAGSTVHRLNYIGDYGTTFGQICYAFKTWGSSEKLHSEGIRHLLDIYVRFNHELKTDPSLQEHGKDWFVRIENGDPEATKLWNLFREISIKEFQRIYQRMGVTFTDWSGESFYSKKMDAALSRVTQSVPTQESEGATVFFLDAGDPPMIVKKSDGSTTYATRDIAAAYDRQEKYKADFLFYVVANQQALHFKQLFSLLRKADFPKATALEHIKFGMLSFKDGTMSTRQGKIIFLDEVLDQASEKALSVINEKNPQCDNKEEVAEAIGIGAVIFNDLKSRRERDVRFSWEEALSFDGDSGPYIQYTHARTCALFDRLGEPGSAEFPPNFVLDDHSNALAWRLSLFPWVIQRSCEERDLYHTAQFLLDLCGSFNHFYNHTILRDLSGTDRSVRLQIVKCTQLTLRKGLQLLGLKAPERI